MKTNMPEDARLTSGAHISYWTDTHSTPLYTPLTENIDTDVVIVGGGLGGLSVAYCAAKSGKKVVVIEDGMIGSGETGRTTAQLVTALDDRYYEMERIFGAEKTKLIADSHKAAIDFVEQTVKDENIECGFERVNGFLFLHPSDEHDSLEKELHAAKCAGVAVDLMDHVPGMLVKQKCIRFFNQAQFHPLRYLSGLCKAIEARGGKIFTGTHAADIGHKGVVTKEGFVVKADHIVVATNNPVNNLFIPYDKEYPYRTYVIGALIEKGKLPPAFWWDTGDMDVDSRIPPYHYVRIHPFNAEHDLLIAGGEDHATGDTSKTGVPEQDRYRLVEEWTREHFPIKEVIYHWSGQVSEPMDGLAFIGRNAFDYPNVYIVTGDSGNGMTHCSLAGLIINDLINGVDNPWAKIYSPYRFTLSESGPAFRQMMNEILGLLKRDPVNKEKLESVQNGEAKVIDLMGGKYGVYRDDYGSLHIVSAKCTHLGCSIAWNSDELSWDCPCHGSRFTYDGKVVQGPANKDLASFTEHQLIHKKHE